MDPIDAPHIYVFTDIAPDRTLAAWRAARRPVAKARFLTQLVRAARHGEVHIFFPSAHRRATRPQ
jgi:hypothetical protein